MYEKVLDLNFHQKIKRCHLLMSVKYSKDKGKQELITALYHRRTILLKNLTKSFKYSLMKQESI